MEYTNKTEQEVRRAKKQLAQQAAEALRQGNPEMGSERGSELIHLFSTSEPSGKQIYKSFSDGELLDVLRARTKELGHIPAQKEVFWVYRSYLRMRFEKWPYALKQAGLSTKAGKGGMTLKQMEERKERYAQLMEMVRTKATELGRPPHMFEMEDIQKELKNWFMTWAEVLDAAGIDRRWQQNEILYKVKNFNDEEKSLLDDLEKLARRLGRSPLRTEVPDEIRRKLNRRCGTWRNTLYQIGLEPVSKISPFGNTYLDRGREQQKKHKDVLENSLYKLVNPDAGTKKMLTEVKVLAEKLGRAPLKGELSSRTYSCLIRKCTTYRNVLYQVGLSPLERSEAIRIQTMLRAKKKEKDG